MSADTFSTIAFPMRHGARLPNQQAFVPSFAQPAFFDPLHSSEEEEEGMVCLPVRKTSLPPEEYLEPEFSDTPSEPVPQD
jgi:hypothetical protein